MVKEVVKVIITTTTCETIYSFTATFAKSTPGTHKQFLELTLCGFHNYLQTLTQAHVHAHTLSQ